MATYRVLIVTGNPATTRAFTDGLASASVDDFAFDILACDPGTWPDMHVGPDMILWDCQGQPDWSSTLGELASRAPGAAVAVWVQRFDLSLLAKAYELGADGIVSGENMPGYSLAEGFQVAMAHKRGRLAFQSRAVRRRKLLEMARQAHDSLDLHDVFTSICREAREVLASHGCAVYRLSDAERLLLPMAAVEGDYSDAIMNTPLQVDDSYTGIAVRSRETMLFNHALEDNGRGFHIPGTPRHVDEHVLAVPFLADGQVLGAMCLNRMDATYSSDDRALAETLAGYMSSALRNARLYEDVAREVAERRRVEAALRGSEAKFRGIVESSQDGIALVDESGTLVGWNGALQGITGLPACNVLGRKVWDIYPEMGLLDPESASQVCEDTRRLFFECVESGDAPFLRRPLPLSLRADDGRITHAQMICFPIPTDKGYMIGGVVRDITADVEAREALGASEARYRTLFDRVPVGLYRTKHDGEILDANRALAEMLGFDRAEDVIGTNARDFYLQPDLFDDEREAMREQRVLRDFVLPLRGRGGKTTWAEDSSSPVVDDDGRIHYEGSLVDVTDRYAALEALRDSERRYRGLFQHAPIGIWEEDRSAVKRGIDALRARGIVDIQAYIEERPHLLAQWSEHVSLTNANRAAHRLLGTSSLEELRSNLGLILGPPDSEAMGPTFSRFLTGALHVERERTAHTLDGREVRISLSAVVAPGYEDTWERVLVAITDLTEVRRLEAQLREAQKLEAIGRLAGGIAHEFNNQLTIINGFSDLVIGDLAQDHAAHDDLMAIRLAGERAAELTRQLLAFGRRQTLRMRVIDLNETVAAWAACCSACMARTSTCGSYSMQTWAACGPTRARSKRSSSIWSAMPAMPCTSWRTRRVLGRRP